MSGARHPMKTIQVESEVGPDGVLVVRISLGEEEARRRVLVTIEPAVATEESPHQPRTDWREFLTQTYGSCAGLGLEEPEDLPLQPRDWSR